MEFIFRLNAQLAHQILPYLNDISLALVATVLVVYGDKLNAVLKKAVSHWIFIVRVCVFILMCTFGYGLLTVWIQPFVRSGILYLPLEYRPLFILLCFVILGIFAERKRHL
ncbi:DUF3392 domain-containing protein [Marinomonas sp. 15G1-11]|uniref:DUF3392 domain-containing protein n=1 Tax=Marinomonas phaeophyticola TaxID=3004091 RepID=A0ABT4JX65_9GAMM|nr:DUF3392 domain-containing protein [Marinomonas sp. 15G1-11]MCZ2722159.1 DUF3392 domain-containing protein [Marinomonas sp. 15G1-11]